MKKERIKLEVVVEITHSGSATSKKEAIKMAKEIITSSRIGSFPESANPIKARLITE